MELTMPYRTLTLLIFFGSYCISSAINNTDTYFHEHPTNQSSIISVLTKDAVASEDNSSLTARNASDISSEGKDGSDLHDDHAAFLEMVRGKPNVNHDGHDHHQQHSRGGTSMLGDQAPFPGNDLSKIDSENKDSTHAGHLEYKSISQADPGENMNHDGHDHMDHKDHDNMDHKDHDNKDHKDHEDMGHDMHMHMNGSDMHGMMMWFHAGVEEVILFKEWKVTTVGGMIGSVVGIILLGMLYEGLKYFREYLFKQYVSSMQFATVAVTGESGRVTQVHKVEKHRMLSVAHAVQTYLHVMQIVLSYFLMLIFMTYNIWLCLAVVIGAGIGYFIFGWKKATVVDITEHCH